MSKGEEKPKSVPTVPPPIGQTTVSPAGGGAGLPAPTPVPADTPPADPPDPEEGPGEDDLDDFNIDEWEFDPSEEFDPDKHKAYTAKALAITLLAILGSTILLHYGSLLYISHINASDEVARKARIEPFIAAFNSWLPVISGLVSAACTYYFTRDRDSK